jgi:hypothetical protein
MFNSPQYTKVKLCVVEYFESENPQFIDDSLTQLFTTIQAPNSLRGMQFVLSSLLAMDKVTGARFSNYFGINQKHVSFLASVIDKLVEEEQYDFANKHLGNGWCNDRPLYTLLFYYEAYGHSGVKARWLAIFLDHYFSNKDKITKQSGYRLEKSCSAMRLLLSTHDQNQFSPVVYCRGLAVSEIAEELIENSQREGLANKTISYMRQLSHFFALNWGVMKERRRRSVTRHGDTRRNHTKLEPIIGAGPGLLAKIPEVTSDAILKGLNLEDCFTDLLSIQSEPEDTQRPAYELPMLAPVKDKSLKALKSKNISQRIRSGHNISLMDKSMLQPHELLILFDKLQTLAKLGNKEVKGVPAIIISLTCWCMLLTGKNLMEILAFNITRSKNKDGVWQKTNINLYWQFEIVRAVQTYDETLSSYCRVSLPTFLVELVNAVHGSFGNPKLYEYLIPEQYTKTIKKALETWLSKLSDSAGIRVGENKLSSYIAHRLLAKEYIDPIIFDFAFSNRTYLSRVTRHYSRVKTREVAEGLSQFWGDVENDIKKVALNVQLPKGFSDCRAAEGGNLVGSVFTPSTVQVCQLVAEIKAPLLNADVLLVRKKLSALIDYHNQYVTYLAYMVLYASGYRAVYNPLPSLDLVLPRYRALVISDKDDSDFTHTRLVALPDLLARQIEYYRDHLLSL